jgi:sugar phosphate isomerase/epimerase
MPFFGRSSFQWAEFMKALAAVKYNGLFNYEIPGETNIPVEVSRLKLRYIKDVTAYMQSLI